MISTQSSRASMSTCAADIWLPKPGFCSVLPCTTPAQTRLVNSDGASNEA